MLEYNIVNIILLLLAFTFCFYKPNKKKDLIFIFLAFSSLFLLSTLRFNIGYDYDMYVEGFYKMGIDGYSKISYLDWEWGYNLYSKVIVQFTRNPKIFMGITAFLCLISPAYFIYKYSKKIWLSTFLYFNMWFFYCTMNFLRQSLAIAITLFAYGFLKKRKFIPYCLIILLAATFHTTALIMIPVYFLVNMKPSIRELLFYSYGLLFFYISSKGFIDIITTFYHSEYKNSIFLQGLSSIHSILPILLLLLTFVFLKKLISLDNDNKFLINMLIFSTFIMVIMSSNAIFERFSYYTYIYIILLIPQFVLLIEKKKGFEKNEHMLFSIPTSLIIVVFAYAYNILGLFVGTSGVHGVFPYASWIY